MWSGLAFFPILDSSPPCAVSLNMAGRQQGLSDITLWTGSQAQDGPRAQPGPQQDSGRGRLLRAPPTADTGHSLVQLTQSSGYISQPCSPPPHPQGKHSPTHRDRGMDKMAQGQGAGGTGRPGGGSAEAGQRCPHGVVYYDSISQAGRQAGGSGT